MYNIHTLLDLSLAPTRYKENSKLYPFKKKTHFDFVVDEKWPFKHLMLINESGCIT